MKSKFIKKRVEPIFLICSLILILCSVTISNNANATEWSMETDCAACHTHESATSTSENSLHSTHNDMSCTSCHSQEDRLATVHRKMSADISKLRRLKRTSISEDGCIACHGSWEELSNLTKESTLIRDIEGLIVNPHIVRTELNATNQHDRVTCTTCHQMHTDRVHNPDTTLEATANGVCETCHHAQVYTCGTCHN